MVAQNWLILMRNININDKELTETPLSGFCNDPIIDYKILESEILEELIRMMFVMRLNSEEIILSIDINLQQSIRRNLIQTVKHYEAESGLALVLDITNGEILSSVSYPDFNPNNKDFNENNSKFFRSKLSRLSHYCDIEEGESYSSVSRLIIGNNEENNWIMKIFNEKEWDNERLRKICINIGHEDNPALSRKTKAKLIDYVVKSSP